MDASRVFFQTAVFQTTAITGSPAAGAETIVATLPIPANIRADQRVYLLGWLAFTLGTTAASFGVRIRQTNVAGTTVANSGSVTGVAASLFAPSIIGIDSPGLQNSFTYVMTLIANSGSAASTVSAVGLIALLI